MNRMPVRRRGASSLEQAQWAAEQGWAVAPVPVGGKHPIVKWGSIGYRTPDELADDWPEGPTDVSVICGPSDLVVIDVDLPDGEESLNRLVEGHSMPETMEVRSPSGGRHFIFKAMGKKFIKHPHDRNLDIQGNGGIIVLTSPGREITRLMDPVPIPEWLANRLQEKERGLSNSNGTKRVGEADLIDMIRNGIPKGMGNWASGSFSMSMVNGPSDELIEEIWVKLLGRDDPRERDKQRGEISRARSKKNSESGDFDDENSQEPELFIDFRDLDKIPDPKPLIKGWIDCGTVVTVAGETGSYKTFAMLDLALAAATGGKWLDKFPVEGGAIPVLYVVGEGGYGLKLRGRVWEGQNERVSEGMATFWMRPKKTMAGKTFWPEIRDEAIEREAKLIFLDTLSSLGPDMDESKDAALFIRRCTQLSTATGATVVIIHHSGWGSKERVPGGSALEFNVDTVIVMSKLDDSEYRQIWLKKSKDGPADERVDIELIESHGSGYLKTAEYEPKINRKPTDDDIMESIIEFQNMHPDASMRKTREYVMPDMNIGQAKFQEIWKRYSERY